MKLPWLPPDATFTVEPATQPKRLEDPALEFPPYGTYRANEERLKEFVDLTSTAYQLAQQLLFSSRAKDLPTVAMGEPNPDEWSYSMADVTMQPEVIAGWLRYEEYAEHEETAPPGDWGDVQSPASWEQIEAHPANGDPVILWPPEDLRPEGFKAPKPGSYTVGVGEFAVSVAESEQNEFDLGDPEQLDTAQKHYLRLAHALGEPAQVSVRAEAVIYRAALLLEWTSFETFIRETVEVLPPETPWPDR